MLGDGKNLSGSGRKQLWGLLKKKFPKNSQATPVGKKNSKGKLVTNHKELKRLNLKTYTQRLRNRPMKEELEELKKVKEELFDIRIVKSEENRTLDYG